MAPIPEACLLVATSPVLCSHIYCSFLLPSIVQFFIQAPSCTFQFFSSSNPHFPSFIQFLVQAPPAPLKTEFLLFKTSFFPLFLACYILEVAFFKSLFSCSKISFPTFFLACYILEVAFFHILVMFSHLVFLCIGGELMDVMPTQPVAGIMEEQIGGGRSPYHLQPSIDLTPNAPKEAHFVAKNCRTTYPAEGSTSVITALPDGLDGLGKDVLKPCLNLPADLPSPIQSPQLWILFLSPLLSLAKEKLKNSHFICLGSAHLAS
ncbi:hypothetical protein L208DRAFT_1381859 [Tricholoma matsutake]|nr:hypothetical protein L208DRAFT_1381859 [Tricholoma matsutake 945]